MTIVNRIIHVICHKPFYEIEGEEIENCPHCKEKLETEDCAITIQRQIIVNPIDGNLSYEVIHK
jgi:hypothetical protein